ncbi:hypoxanthine phosphoribosyltransferase [Clostridium acetobutylicum]|uniref:Hypoxanthine phosphoribosyltransferase n=1 Tax=Clostridium acetobutylicum (strain ATCC 824 / DSM 792 / JCM 1419 / IAM 19013 / LMG 5710 / NBRC 13948 / NRRL B-527 / VKM B-1787 / 2291 / W) TaxID=272562 RepID=Q97EB1_CLOAB|nr:MULTISPECIES: hypoxanthine phosphoribosyltransferase [Clostridium]AAK81139.1 Hypoxanthine-guanine phosphoribosyltransferase [Clostridium acetobutylicum ATCC 824]ADZ22244.1 Hypoxanthine-guanine phosphoribosyltransferase [Clostridium acetobutylicum EA 2018]AEI33261.1 hypoxanthine-guanine phosphoribosyltransferase [Clostridium acetobutylicum DSM 1731]AWV81192.1 hypoxanthine phosphoribosyltransferase [Clostridium acetobutylicum]MBC2396124.1 hypoxanthine phosphoribosyltransferase [Clostridium ac
MREDIKEVLLDEEKINEKVKELGKKISEDYKGKDLILIGILKGSVVFMGNLVKYIDIPCAIDFMSVSSYGNGTSTSGIVKVLKDLDSDVEGKDILIVEDIIDSGVTLKYLMGHISGKKPNSIEIITLLNKPERRRVEINVKYTGFIVPDYFLVGYGLDYAEKYRNLPYIGILKDEIYE